LRAATRLYRRDRPKQYKNPAERITAAAPELLELPRVGVEVTGQLLVTAGDNPERLRSEGAFAQLWHCTAAGELWENR
jgi:hypothetical protein